MPSEQRLHPASILFGLLGQLREFAIPLLLAAVAGSRGGALDTVALIVLIPYTVVAVGRYWWFRYRFEPHELVVRSGLVFRNERHIPYARIQNLDAVENVLHRVLGVVDVRVDTGSGSDTDARLSVVTWNAYADMRERVFAGRQAATEAAGQVPASADERPRVLLELPPRELVVHGLIENRGGIVIAGIIGLLWEAGIAERLIDRVVGDDIAQGGLIRDILASARTAGGVPWDRVALVGVALLGLLAVIRLLSVVLALVRLHGFRVARMGEDLRAEYGLLTRVSATIPLRRIQTLTVTEGVLHRLFGRVSVRVDTAGGAGPQGGERRRESLAPVIARGRWQAFVRDVMPELDLTAIDWQRPGAGATAREVRRRFIVAAVLSAPLAYVLHWQALVVFVALAAWGVLAGFRYVAHLRWAVADGAVLFKSGWLSRHLSIARFTRIQSVAMRESPFDRRWSMARVSVDTAGAGAASHRIDIPYLARDIAANLHAGLSAAAARTAFPW